MSSKQTKYIKDRASLDQLRSKLIRQCAKYKIQVRDVDEEEKNVPANERPADVDDEKIEVQCASDEGVITQSAIFSDVAKLGAELRIAGTALERSLQQFERKLTNKAAKKSIPPTPEDWPDDIYLCETHRSSLNKKLSEYTVKVPKAGPKCSDEAVANCVRVKQCYERIQTALGEDDQAHDPQQFPDNYFSITMAKLLNVQQSLDSLSKRDIRQGGVVKETRSMNKVVKHLMDLLIVVRQSMNPTAAEICTLITTISSIIGGGVAWMVTNSAFITVLVGLLMFFVGVLILGVIFGDDKQKWVAGAALVGASVGFTAAGIGTAALVTKESSEIGAMIGTFCGGPGAGTLAGAAIGGFVGGLYAMGVATMYKYG